jgi:hypothetical protein
VAAAFLILTRARVVHQDPAHHPRRHGQEVRAVVPLDGGPVDQANERLVDERGRLEAMPHALSGHAAVRDSMEFVMDERNQSLKSALVALAPLQ